MLKKAVLGAVFVVVFVLVVAAPRAAEASSIPYNCASCGSHNTAFDLTYSVLDPLANSYILTITATYQPTGAGTPDFTYLNDIAFELLGVTYENGTPALLSSPAEDTWSVIPGGLAAAGCNGNGAGFYCLQSLGFGATHGPAGDTDTWTLRLDLPGTTSLGGTLLLHLKAQFTDANGRKVGSLISNDGTGYLYCDGGPCDPFTPVPEPASLLLLGAGLTGIAMRLRRKRA